VDRPVGEIEFEVAVVAPISVLLEEPLASQSKSGTLANTEPTSTPRRSDRRYSTAMPAPGAALPPASTRSPEGLSTENA
jgi:hypothetical protein